MNAVFRAFLTTRVNEKKLRFLPEPENQLIASNQWQIAFEFPRKSIAR